MKLVLDGSWHLLPVEQFAQGYYPYADTNWISQALPAHWQQHPLLERYAGKMVYRKRFAAAAAQPGQRQWLRLNGIFYWSQPFLNGVDLGRHEGYFAAQEHEVTTWVQAEPGLNELVVEVECPDEHNKFGKRLITGVFSHWDCLDPGTNPGGIWLPVELITTGPVRAKQIRMHTEQISDAAAELRYQADFDAASAQDVTLRWTITPHNFVGQVQVVEQQRSLAQGGQTIGGSLMVRDPQLWWTHDLGHPNLYEITLEVICGDTRSDTQQFRFGIRTIVVQDWIFYLNNVRMFIKGNNYPPGDTRIATMTRERCDQDMRLVQQAHMNLLRVHAHVDHPMFYEAANAAGILIWQDFPLQWLYRREIVSEATRQVVQMVQLLYNHPSIAVWCMHNEPIYTADTKDERISTRIRTYISVFVFSWNRDVLDTKLKAVAEQYDQTRMVVRASGEYDVPLLREGTDSHFYFGWYIVYGRLYSWPKIIKTFPRNIRFVTEFGAQSFPNLESSLKFIDGDIRQIDWQYLIERHHLQPDTLAHWVDWRSASSLEQLIDMTQDYQIMVNRFYIDRLRFYKYRPTGGVVPFMLLDSNPAIQWSIIDYWRVPKRSYAAMRMAFSPQYIFTILDMEHYPQGTPLEVPIYVVNDAHRAVASRAVARLVSPSGRELARIEREFLLPADCMAVELERLRLTPTEAGTYQLTVELIPTGGEAIQQSYPIHVV
jgi:beta-mannosidase